VRRVFSSPRLENVERVAKLLEDAGIQTKITHGRSYRGGLRGNFSYREGADDKPVPAVWVVFSEDQPKARAMLREQGLLDSTRTETGYRLPTFRTEDPVSREDAGRKRAFRLKVGLLLAIAVALVLAFLTQLGGGPAADVPGPVDPRVLATGETATPDALAVAVLAGELPADADGAVCLSVDGTDPTALLLEQLDTPGRVIPLSQCPTHALPRLWIHGYRTRGTSGSGSITFERAADANATPLVETYEVHHGERGWRVIELL
jgi:hypothetical protein